eukprot:TRINITY_DN9652_c0_g1_i1.p1 TRINITY_DN9652_c0_g1~~TRINITY_DN9652_c0_g1_i1.p1  ORF type:complete len:1249 (-),score=266.54 TRINITY_DN9652_c0_g1_i1:90-3365(-)
MTIVQDFGLCPRFVSPGVVTSTFRVCAQPLRQDEEPALTFQQFVSSICRIGMQIGDKLVRGEACSTDAQRVEVVLKYMQHVDLRIVHTRFQHTPGSPLSAALSPSSRNFPEAVPEVTALPATVAPTASADSAAAIGGRLHGVFLFYCAYGDPLNDSDVLTMPKLHRLLRDANIYDLALLPQHADLVVLDVLRKVSGAKSDPVVTMDQFVTCLRQLALRKYVPAYISSHATELSTVVPDLESHAFERLLNEHIYAHARSVYSDGADAISGLLAEEQVDDAAWQVLIEYDKDLQRVFAVYRSHSEGEPRMSRKNFFLFCKHFDFSATAMLSQPTLWRVFIRAAFTPSPAGALVTRTNLLSLLKRSRSDTLHSSGSRGSAGSPQSPRQSSRGTVTETGLNYVQFCAALVWIAVAARKELVASEAVRWLMDIVRNTESSQYINRQKELLTQVVCKQATTGTLAVERRKSRVVVDTPPLQPVASLPPAERVHAILSAVFHAYTAHRAATITSNNFVKFVEDYALIDGDIPAVSQQADLIFNECATANKEAQLDFDLFISALVRIAERRYNPTKAEEPSTAECFTLLMKRLIMPRYLAVAQALRQSDITDHSSARMLMGHYANSLQLLFEKYSSPSDGPDSERVMSMDSWIKLLKASGLLPTPLSDFDCRHVYRECMFAAAHSDTGVGAAMTYHVFTRALTRIAVDLAAALQSPQSASDADAADAPSSEDAGANYQRSFNVTENILHLFDRMGITDSGGIRSPSAAVTPDTAVMSPPGSALARLQMYDSDGSPVPSVRDDSSAVSTVDSPRLPRRQSQSHLYRRRASLAIPDVSEDVRESLMLVFKHMASYGHRMNTDAFGSATFQRFCRMCHLTGETLDVDLVFIELTRLQDRSAAKLDFELFLQSLPLLGAVLFPTLPASERLNKVVDRVLKHGLPRAERTPRAGTFDDIEDVDVEVLRVICEKYHQQLEWFFEVYCTAATGRPTGVEFARFFRMLQDLEWGSFVPKGRLRVMFEASAQTNPAVLTFNEFVNLLIKCALEGYGRHPYDQKWPSPANRAEALFSLMAFADKKLFLRNVEPGKYIRMPPPPKYSRFF